jgi:PIN domain nuclease of toxin-antitoxin system
MRTLVDTHSLYWFIEGDERLSESAIDTMCDPDNEILMSPASYWEMAIKISLRKWQLNRPYQEFMDIALLQYEFHILPISPLHTERLVYMPFYHRDPFDRLIVAQAQTEQIPIVSSDTQLDS